MKKKCGILEEYEFKKPERKFDKALKNIFFLILNSKSFLF